ncbi:MAG: hypothetical protein EAZ89_02100 [Bacteroidetes bacterium]|nr:MAG: hypothetical protein EAZ89_02100 [Bacteroidota bacterium]
MSARFCRLCLGRNGFLTLINYPQIENLIFNLRISSHEEIRLLPPRIIRLFFSLIKHRYPRTCVHQKGDPSGPPALNLKGKALGLPLQERELCLVGLEVAEGIA